MHVEEAQLARYGEIVARLSRPLADREAVFWLARIDEDRFGQLESACLAAIDRDPAAALAFARGFVRVKALVEETEAATRGRAEPAPMARSEGAQEERDLTLETDTIPLGLTTEVPSPLKAENPDAMFTLASVTQASPRPRGEDE